MSFAPPTETHGLLTFNQLPQEARLQIAQSQAQPYQNTLTQTQTQNFQNFQPYTYNMTPNTSCGGISTDTITNPQSGKPVNVTTIYPARGSGAPVTYSVEGADLPPLTQDQLNQYLSGTLPTMAYPPNMPPPPPQPPNMIQYPYQTNTANTTNYGQTTNPQTLTYSMQIVPQQPAYQNVSAQIPQTSLQALYADGDMV